MFAFAFVLGMSHSGSTLLAFLLNAHPEIVSIGETSRISELLPSRWRPGNDRCSCGENYYACDFWNSTLAGMAVRGHGIGNPDFFSYPRRRKKQAAAGLKAFVEAATAVSGARVFLDSSKHPQLVKALAENADLDLWVLNLLRDGRGVIHSWRKKRPDSPAEKIVRRWLRQEARRESALELIPAERRLDVRYEDLAQRPAATLRAIFRFLETDPDVEVTTGFKTTVPHHIIGNRMRLDEEETIIFDEGWRSGLPADWLETFRRMGGVERNQKLGYGA